MAEDGRSVSQRSEAKSRDATEIAVVTATPDDRLIARVSGRPAAALAVTVNSEKHPGYRQTRGSFGRRRL